MNVGFSSDDCAHNIVNMFQNAIDVFSKKGIGLEQTQQRSFCFYLKFINQTAAACLLYTYKWWIARREGTVVSGNVFKKRAIVCPRMGELSSCKKEPHFKWRGGMHINLRLLLLQMATARAICQDHRRCGLNMKEKDGSLYQQVARSSTGQRGIGSAVAKLFFQGIGHHFAHIVTLFNSSYKAKVNRKIWAA